MNYSRLTILLFMPLALPGTALAQYGPGTILFAVNRPTEAMAIDADLDGDLDLVAFRNGGGELHYVENIGDGTFGAVQIPGIAVPGTQRAESVDLDEDGLNDILVTEATNPDFVWIRGLGSGQFSAPITIAVGLAVETVRQIDRDGDGDLDFLVCSPATVGWIENLGGGSFGPVQSVLAGATGLTAADAADFDGDGILDVAISTTVGSRISWYRGLAGGSYGAENVITTGAGGATDLVVADLDGSGSVDVAAVAQADGKVIWFSNGGTGNFGSQQLIDNASGSAYELRVLDWNDDGMLDVLVGPRGGRYVIYRNLGFGFFGVPVDAVPFGTGEHTSFAWADFDGDADWDVVAANFNLNRVQFFPNIRALGATYCTSNPNSTGDMATLEVTGFEEADRNAMVLTTSDLPPSQFGIYVNSMTPAMIPGPGGSEGILCLGGAVGRYTAPGQILFSGPQRRFRLVLDLEMTPTPDAFVQMAAGQTWHFQTWYRDLDVNGDSTSNFSDAVSVVLQ